MELMPHLSKKKFYPNVYKFILPKTIDEWELYIEPTYLYPSNGLHSQYVSAEYSKIDKSTDTLVPFYFPLPGISWKFKCFKNGIYYFTNIGKRT